VTDESGLEQVVVQPLPGPGARTQVSLNGGVEPVWSRDGRRIYYRDNQRLVAANVRTTPDFAVTSRVLMFEYDFLGSTLPHANYDVAPDGAHFLFLKPAEDAELQVVVGWRDELRARLAGQAGNQ
jgi:eukaryotic-like serine/threonine-protein kinase